MDGDMDGCCKMIWEQMTGTRSAIFGIYMCFHKRSLDTDFNQNRRFFYLKFHGKSCLNFTVFAAAKNC